ncbi:MAG: class I SAM-dependent methyltransferase [Nannocystaceae bacterium]
MSRDVPDPGGAEAPDLAEATMLEILAVVLEGLAAGAPVVALRVADPDRGRGLYAGELVDLGGRACVHRPLRVWLDLAERLRLRLLTPRPCAGGLVELRLEPLDAAAPWRADDGDPRERYGAASPFQRISKLEEPDLLLDVADALDRVDPPADARVLGLGINRGDELALLCALRPALAERGSFVGVDHSASALALARDRVPAADLRLVVADLRDLERLDLGAPFDLVVAFGALQSPGVDDRALLRHLVQARLRPTGALLLTLPNSRYVDGEQLYGARMRNFAQPELSLLIKDVAFYRRYLQQHRRQVFVTGKRELLITAVARDAAAPAG